MAYMDVQPARPNGRTAVLLHGKNFCAATWEPTITASDRGGLPRDRAGPDRLLQVEQAGRYQFSFQQLAGNTHALLAIARRRKGRS